MDYRVSSSCLGTGQHSSYVKLSDGSFQLRDPGNPWTHEDGRLGLSETSHADDLDAYLDIGLYDITAESIELRRPFSFRGRRSGFGNPNGEYPPHSGSVLRFATNGLRVGRPSRIMEGIDDRMSLPTVENLAMYRDPLRPADDLIGTGAAIRLDEPSDQFTLNNVNIACCTFGLLSTAVQDAMRVRALHTANVTFPLYFDSDRSWYPTIVDSCFADGDGPCLVQGRHHTWSFQNVLIVRQGRRRTHLPACNILWRINNSSFLGGNIEDPGKTFPMNDGRYVREESRIDADGMLMYGNGNQIATHFVGASGEGRANLRLTGGASRNIIQSRFDGGKNGAVDLIIEEGCADNVVYVQPGMHIVDRGTNTQFK